ncbi:protein FAM177B [Gastrophryne carolinensis]
MALSLCQNEVELGDVETKRLPRRIIHFASGETMEEYSTDEEEDEEEEQRIDFRNMDTSQMNWATFVQFWILRIATTAFFTCDFLGGKLAALFGLNSPKYQYAIDEYKRAQEQDSDAEDGEEVEETEDKTNLSERNYIQMQSMDYGSIPISQASPGTEDEYHIDSEIQQSNISPDKQ